VICVWGNSKSPTRFSILVNKYIQEMTGVQFLIFILYGIVFYEDDFLFVNIVSPSS
jgi:hypothetical protein